MFTLKIDLSASLETSKTQEVHLMFLTPHVLVAFMELNL